MPNFEEYQLFLEYVNKLTERRQRVTTTYLSVNAAITGAIAFLFKDVQIAGWEQQLSALALLVSGVIACALWRKLITQHSTLLEWWFEQLRQLENSIPESAKLLTQEYQEMYQEKRGRVRIGLTRYEASLTWLFTIVYVGFGLAIVITFLSSVI